METQFKKVEFDYSKLKGKIKEVCGTQDNLASKLSIGRVSLSQRLNNQLVFSQDDILEICSVLNISDAEIPIYFFTEKV